jgi:hypothetical protein
LPQTRLCGAHRDWRGCCELIAGPAGDTLE